MGRIPWSRKWSNHTFFESSRRVGSESRRRASEQAPLKSYGASKFEKGGPASPLIDRRWRCRSYFRILLPWFLAIVVQSFTALVFTFVEFGAAFLLLGGALEWRPWLFFFFTFAMWKTAKWQNFVSKLESSQKWFIYYFPPHFRDVCVDNPSIFVA